MGQGWKIGAGRYNEAGMETNKFHQAGERRAARVEDLFAIVAPRYDFINDLQSLGLHRRWKRALVKMADIQPGDRALDVCCGTGDVAFALRQSGAEVTALDFSPAMLAIAQQRAKDLLPPCSGGLRPPQIPAAACAAAGAISARRRPAAALPGRIV